MPDQPRPFRLRVLDVITDAIANVSPANGFHHDLSASVFRGRLAYGPNDPIPMVSILEDPRAVDLLAAQGIATVKGEWTLLIQGFCEDDLENPTDTAHYLAADVRAALAPLASPVGHTRNYLGLGASRPCVDAIQIGFPIVRPPDDFSAKAYFWLPLKLKLVE